MKRIRIQTNKRCKEQLDLMVGGDFCMNACPMFVKKQNNKISCRADTHTMISDTDGNIIVKKK